MPKEFYTEKDIEDMVKRGVTTLEINENIVLTELAYEKANRLGMRLNRQSPDNPPSAPVRPYISPVQPQRSSGVTPSFSQGAGTSPVPTDRTEPARTQEGDLHQRIRSAVIARLGNQVDSNLLDVIIKRVLTSTGVK